MKNAAIGILFIIFLQSLSVSHAAIVFTNDIFEGKPESLTIDSDGNATSDIQLIFGAVIQEVMRWDITNSQFHLSDDLVLDGNLYVQSTKVVMNAGMPAEADVEIIAQQGEELEGTIRYSANLQRWEVSNNGGPFQPIITDATTLNALQVRRTTAFPLTTSFTNVSFDTEDVTAASGAIVFDEQNPEQIVIQEDGLYAVYYNAIAGGVATSTHLMSARITKNILEVLPGSLTVNSNYQDEYSSNSAQSLVSLQTGDVLSLQLQRSNITDETQGDIVLSVLKLNGLQGPQGLPGSVGLGTNETVFTIDQDNTGVGQNIQIVAEQGIDENGVLQYNGQENRWEISDDGGPFLPLTSVPQILQIYETGTTSINALTPVSWDGTDSTVRIVDDVFTHDAAGDAEKIYFLESGVYNIAYQINWTNTQNQARNIFCTPRINGIVTSPPVGASYAYKQNSTNSRGTNTANFYLQLNAGDYVEVACQSVGTNGAVNTLAEQSFLRMRKVK